MGERKEGGLGGGGGWKSVSIIRNPSREGGEWGVLRGLVLNRTHLHRRVPWALRWKHLASYTVQDETGWKQLRAVISSWWLKHSLKETSVSDSVCDSMRRDNKKTWNVLFDHWCDYHIRITWLLKYNVDKIWTKSQNIDQGNFYFQRKLDPKFGS